MNKLFLTIVSILILTISAFSQSQSTINQFNHISSLTNVAARKLYFNTLSNKEKSDLIVYHINEKQNQWEANSFAGLSPAQNTALTNLKNQVSEELVENAEDNSQNGLMFNDFNSALEEVESLFTEGQLTELKTIGNYDSNDFNFGDEIFIDEVTNEVYTLQCPRGKWCVTMCNCSLYSFCSGVRGCYNNNNCTYIEEGCGCFWLWRCDGTRPTD